MRRPRGIWLALGALVIALAATTATVLAARGPDERERAASHRAVALATGAAERPAPQRRRLPRAPGRQGVLRTVPAPERERAGPATLRFLVEVEGGLRVDRRRFAATVERTLRDRRGWGAGGARRFARVDRGPVAFRVALASPGLTDQLCLPYQTNGIYSCHQGGRAVLNMRRWRSGAAAYRGRLVAYRRYLVNHEVGHGLGHGHLACGRAGAKAPVMMQQTKGVAPCRPNPWPLPVERP